MSFFPVQIAPMTLLGRNVVKKRMIAAYFDHFFSLWQARRAATPHTLQQQQKTSPGSLSPSKLQLRTTHKVSVKSTAHHNDQRPVEGPSGAHAGRSIPDRICVHLVPFQDFEALSRCDLSASSRSSHRLSGGRQVFNNIRLLTRIWTRATAKAAQWKSAPSRAGGG